MGISFTLAIYTTNRGHGRGGTHPTPRRERTSPPSLFFFASFFFSLKKIPNLKNLSLTSRQQPQISSLKPACHGGPHSLPLFSQHQPQTSFAILKPFKSQLTLTFLSPIHNLTSSGPKLILPPTPQLTQV